MLDGLERLRDQLATPFPQTVGDVNVVVHGHPAFLAFANPLWGLERWAASPAARRYVVGRVSTADEIHVLAPSLLRKRASSVPGSREMLALGPAALYARLVIAANNPELPPPATPRRALRSLKWLWLVEGAPRYFSGQTEYARPAIARRLREGPKPTFPPGPRDAAILGGTVFDLLAREEGEEAAVKLATTLHPDGGEAALASAFRALELVHTEGAWRSHLARLATA